MDGSNVLLSRTGWRSASANLPTILYTLFWRRFNTTGLLFSIYGGLGPRPLLIVFSPVFSGGPNSIIKGVDFHLFPLSNPGLVSIPLSFLLGLPRHGGKPRPR